MQGELGTFVEEPDFPPGFQPRAQESIACHPLLILESHFSEDKLSERQTAVNTPMYDGDQTEVMDRVEKDLFLAAKASLDSFLMTVIEEEVYALIKCLKDDEANEVVVGIDGNFNCIFQCICILPSKLKCTVLKNFSCPIGCYQHS